MKFDKERSPCTTCPFKDFTFCGALTRGQNDKPLQQAYYTTQARQNVYIAGETTEDIQIICEGWAARVMRLPDGRRQILSFLLPGDMVSTTALFRDKMNYYVQSLTDVRYSTIKRADILGRIAADPAVMQSFGDVCCREKEEVDDLLTDVGQRVADKRIARLILRLMKRIAMRGMVTDHTFPFPLRQQHIADAVGLTTVHVSRIISAMRKEGIVDIAQGNLKVVDPGKLGHIADIARK